MAALGPVLLGLAATGEDPGAGEQVLGALAGIALLVGFVATVVAVVWLVAQWWRGYGGGRH